MERTIFTVIIGVSLTQLIAIGPVYGNSDRPRGVSISKGPLYVPKDGKFKCLDNSLTIDFKQVNDDYCDCPDGSDEPGTSACPNGMYHCTNAGYVPLNIPASRVNDFICDCCDGSDEYDTDVECENTCREMGKAMREDQERKRQLAEEGVKLRQQWSQEGNKAKQEKQTELEILEAEKQQLSDKREKCLGEKTAAEDPEKEAKDKHQAAWDEQKVGVKATKAFKELDDNADGSVTVEEMQLHPEMDIDGNGEVSPEEAKEHLEDMDSVDEATFVEKVWPHVKDMYKPREREQPPAGDGEEGAEAETTTPPPVQQTVTDDHYDDDEDDRRYDDDDDEDYDSREDEDDDDNLDIPPLKRESGQDEEEPPMPDYDEDTQKLMQAAEEARTAYKEADEAHRNAETKINDLRKYVDLDLGESQEFHGLYDQCYDHTDREYTYTLCPFKSAGQKPKNGGIETSLGTWGEWTGNPDKYSEMKYTGGQGCWNGPARSATVILHCGTKNELVAVSEPNRCEYAFDFNTPAVCISSQQADKKPHDHEHLEL